LRTLTRLGCALTPQRAVLTLMQGPLRKCGLPGGVCGWQFHLWADWSQTALPIAAFVPHCCSKRRQPGPPGPMFAFQVKYPIIPILADARKFVMAFALC